MARSGRPYVVKRRRNAFLSHFPRSSSSYPPTPLGRSPQHTGGGEQRPRGGWEKGGEKNRRLPLRTIGGETRRHASGGEEERRGGKGAWEGQWRYASTRVRRHKQKQETAAKRMERQGRGEDRGSRSETRRVGYVNIRCIEQKIRKKSVRPHCLNCLQRVPFVSRDTSTVHA